MKLIYVAGPYRSKTIYGVSQNIRAAEDVAVKLWTWGAAVICPHKNTAFFDGAVDEPQDENGMVLDDSVFFRGDIEMLKRCDAIVLVPGFEKSVGTMREYTFATLQAIPVFKWESDQIKILEWLKEASARARV